MSDLDRPSPDVKPRRKKLRPRLLLVSSIAILTLAAGLLVFSYRRDSPEERMQKLAETVNRLYPSSAEKPPNSAALTKEEIESLRPKETPAGFDPYGGPMPVVFISNTFPWASHLRWDDLVLAIYEDGEAIWSLNASRCLHQKLSRSELLAIEEKIVSFGDLSSIPRRNMLSHSSDQASTGVLIRLNGKAWAFTMYGHDKPEEMPDSVRALLQYLHSLPFSNGERWTPQYIEVKAWLWNISSQPPPVPVDWPKEFPGLDDPRTIHRKDEYPSLYSIFFDGKQADALESFLHSTGGYPVRMDGKSWQVAVHPILPSEPVWDKAISLCYPAN